MDSIHIPSSIDVTGQQFPADGSPIVKEWEGLAASIGANFSLFPDWTRITAMSHGILEGSELVSVKQNGKILAVLPVATSCVKMLGIKLKILYLVSNKASYHNRPLSVLDSPVLVNILATIGRDRNADVIHLAGIPDESGLGEWLANCVMDSRHMIHRVSGELSPYLRLETTWLDLLASKPKKFRYKVRKRAELLDTNNDLNMTFYDQPDDCGTLLDEIKAIEGHSWKNDAGFSIFERDHEVRYYRLLLPFLASRRAMFANVLYYDDEPISYNLCCLWNGWAGQLKTSFDSRYSELSPGSIVIDHAIRYAIERGAHEFDFLGAADKHKLAWSKLTRSHADYFLYVRSRPKGILVGKLKEIRRHLSNIRQALPTQGHQIL